MQTYIHRSYPLTHFAHEYPRLSSPEALQHECGHIMLRTSKRSDSCNRMSMIISIVTKRVTKKATSAITLPSTTSIKRAAGFYQNLASADVTVVSCKNQRCVVANACISLPYKHITLKLKKTGIFQMTNKFDGKCDT
jgi:hypothetical protein